MKLELGIMAGAESKKFLVDFTKQIDRLEKLTGGKPLAAATNDDDTDPDTETSTDDDADDDFTASMKRAAAKTAKGFDDDAEEEEEEYTPPAKTTKAAKPKKLTLDDVNDACKARAQATGGKAGRAEVLAILKKKFKTESVSELDEDDYAACIKAMAV